MLLYRNYIKDGRIVKTEIEDLPKIVDGMEIQYSLGHRKSEVYSDDFIDPIDFITGKK